MQDLGVVGQDGGDARNAEAFPHDRVVFFSDAVFAIAITLLAIELKLPDAETLEQLGHQQAWGETFSLFIAYVISFVIAGVFWIGHMQTWKHVRHVTGALVWATLLQLMFVALMPFATREYSAAFQGGTPARFALYSAVLAGISLFSCITRFIVVRQEHLAQRLGPGPARWLQWRGVIALAVFLLGIPMAWVVPARWGALVFFLIFPLSMLARRVVLGRAPAATPVPSQGANPPA